MDKNVLKNTIEAKLSSNIWIDNGGIIVDVDDGIITLSGTVSSYFAKIQVVDIVNKILGVRGVVNELQVSLSSHLIRNDKEIAKAAIDTLEWDVGIPKDKIKVTVEKGVVTLSGEVEFNSQKVRAYDDVHALYGVVDVENTITLKPQITFDIKAVEKEIEREFQRNAALHAHKIKVKIVDEKVYLSGVVSSWFEYKEANNAAFSVPGVQGVQNELTIDCL